MNKLIDFITPFIDVTSFFQSPFIECRDHQLSDLVHCDFFVDFGCVSCSMSVWFVVTYCHIFKASG